MKVTVYFVSGQAREISDTNAEQRTMLLQALGKEGTFVLQGGRDTLALNMNLVESITISGMSADQVKINLGEDNGN